MYADVEPRPRPEIEHGDTGGVNWDAHAPVVTRTRERTYADVEPRPRPEIEHGDRGRVRARLRLRIRLGLGDTGG